MKLSKELPVVVFISVHGGGLVAKLCSTLATPWTVACKASLSMGFSRKEYWSGLPWHSPGDPPDPGILPVSLNFLHWQLDCLISAASRKSV